MSRADSATRTTTGFSGRQLVTILGLLLVAVLLAPVGARAAASLVTIAGGSGSGQAHVSGGALLVQSAAGAPTNPALEGTRTISTTPTPIASISGGRLGFSDLVFMNGDAAANIVRIQSAKVSGTATPCAGVPPTTDYVTVEVPGNDTRSVDLSQALVVPRFTFSTGKVCVYATMQNSGFMYVSWTGWPVDGTGVVTTFS
jgi:hypothetical protein